MRRARCKVLRRDPGLDERRSQLPGPRDTAIIQPGLNSCLVLTEGDGIRFAMDGTGWLRPVHNPLHGWPDRGVETSTGELSHRGVPSGDRLLQAGVRSLHRGGRVVQLMGQPSRELP